MVAPGWVYMRILIDISKMGDNGLRETILPCYTPPTTFPSKLLLIWRCWKLSFSCMQPGILNTRSTHICIDLRRSCVICAATPVESSIEERGRSYSTSEKICFISMLQRSSDAFVFSP